MKPADLHAVIGPDFHRLFAGIPTPEAPMPYVTIPADLPPERDPGVVDVTPETVADRATVTNIREQLRKRNEAPRTGDDEPEAA
jgi:hypothetical protein